MRIILFAGKGGVGKTSVAGATGIKASTMGHKTLIMSLDIAHSLSDVFSLNKALIERDRGTPFQVDEGLWIQELDIQEEIQRNWGEVHQYIASLFSSTGLDEILAEELAILPGMEEVSSLLYLNKYIREKTFDVIILDCAPTGESLRFISIPTALEWYIGKIFKIQRRIVSYVRPIAKRFYDIPLPEDDYFKALEGLFVRLQGIDTVLTDPATTTVRMVANPEKIVIKETQRAFLYFHLYKMCVDAVVMNRILPSSIKETYFDD
jgi:arsenite/tail-anchored protein-transporting ATPase